jgi:hypothetical protein
MVQLCNEYMSSGLVESSASGAGPVVLMFYVTEGTILKSHRTIMNITGGGGSTTSSCGPRAMGHA